MMRSEGGANSTGPWGRGAARLRALTGWRADVAAALLGVVAALALPPLFVLPALLVAMPGLLVLVDAAPNWRVALRRGLLFGFGYHLVGLYWVTEAILIEAASYWWLVPFGVPFLALILTPFIGVPCALAKSVAPGWRRVLMLGSVWVLGDLARQFIGTGFPWNPLGSVWAMPGVAGNVFMQPAAWIGTPGLTMATVLLAALPVLGPRGWAGVAAVLAGWAGLGLMRLRGPEPPPVDLQVVLVQGNVAQGGKWDADVARTVFDRYLRLTREGMAGVGDHPALVVWPESSFPGLLDRDPQARAMMADIAAPALGVLAGSVRFPGSDPNKPGPVGQPGDKPRNSLFAITRSGEVAGIYDKWHLVPFGEYAPTWVPLAVSLVPGGGFARGPGPATLHLPGLPPVGPIICYEAIFPAQVVDEADRPDWIVNVTNDAWFGNSSGPRQHLAAARLRAVEEGLPLLRAANTGISAAFDAHGRELARLGMNREGTLVVPLPGKLPSTSFARWGLVIPLLLGFGGAGISLGLVRRRDRPH